MAVKSVKKVVRPAGYVSASEGTKNRTKIPLSDFSEIRAILSDVSKILTEVERSETSLAYFCRKEGLNYRYVLRLLALAQKLAHGETENVKFTPLVAKSRCERFYEDIFGRNALCDEAILCEPEEVSKRVKRALSDKNPLNIPERELAVCKSYYLDGLTLEEIGMLENLTRERVRQVRNKGLKRMQTEAGIKLLYGKNKSL